MASSFGCIPHKTIQSIEKRIGVKCIAWSNSYIYECALVVAGSSPMAQNLEPSLNNE